MTVGGVMWMENEHGYYKHEYLTRHTYVYMLGLWLGLQILVVELGNFN